mmetsp:Transcript_16774/g.27885  ORF Transcript_16774/g.27885 Transcript_16774/m.27885 type:complete len:305 (-) Transcript_16774:120-1034(-)
MIIASRPLRIFGANRVLGLRSLSSTTTTVSKDPSADASTSFGYYLSSFAEECPCSYHAALSDCPQTDALKSQSARHGSTLVLNDDQQFLLACEAASRFDYAKDTEYTESTESSNPPSVNPSPAAASVDFYTSLANEAPSELYPSRHQQNRIVQKIQKIQPVSGQDVDAQPLPRSLLTATFDARAVVITEPDHPFRIVAVNDAWTGLCGFTPKEAEGKSLKDLIQGPDTDTSALREMVEELMTGYEASAIATNYTKAGRPFQNMLRVGRMTEDKYLVGVLREMTPAEMMAGMDVVVQDDRAAVSM